ncbi:TetR/AcrR family transcriptional regulator [Exilibacterium tricleocarpae]|uniref:TetR/AcrR family transcriptional regulator n=1 Tax=Exilibacterium tricleocarpae TaxID=2591008 RepID=A0A545TBI0_9GAMM|nr:TetR/AcrR family transcriptional regulator [Exilibacterium tricleocarpae]TQV74551.1 TetR/AcrR family transcriptional regulator [Exilibacterium tricleocarpae]
MPRPALTPEKKRKVRNDIREAALRLRAKHNSSQITVRAVATEAGISVGTFYTYYENLADLAQALWKEPVDELRLKVEATAKRVKDPVKRIRRMLECYVQFEKDQRTIFRSAFLFVRPGCMSKPEQESLKGEVFYDHLCASIIEGQERGQIRDGNPGDLAQMIWSSVHGALALPINMDRFKFYPSQKMAKHMIQFLVESITL